MKFLLKICNKYIMSYKKTRKYFSIYIHFKIKLNVLGVDLYPPYDMCSLLTLHIRSAFKPSGPSAGAYPSFCSMKRLGVFLPPPPHPGWMPVHCRVPPQHLIHRYAFIHLGWGERGPHVRVKCLAQEHTMTLPDQGLNLGRSIRSQAHWLLGHRAFLLHIVRPPTWEVSRSYGLLRDDDGWRF